MTFQRQLNFHSSNSGEGGWVTSSRISHGSGCLHHQSTLSCFASPQLLILYHHQVPLNAGESPLKPPGFLCNKTISTTSHILGACSVALKQGHFTFRHDNVLSHIFATLKRFTSNIESVPPKPKHLIKFVRKGARATCKKSPHTSIYTMHWIGNY